ncbi:hypothetical protein FA10DRAFT_270203 [Acaromyces ingoldii]|uniref:Secreted protein CSS2 C-terminal domain-containing protein n=1 Tax=Acaromyces ingoldii TaxID=215250 RepID=A0A316YFG7_9BASI|nr:hypothetical protein FA10DRAFT_270203 [Acaromyces ingoldii]PWN86485.1 hypothetical protein FA10DRAFT_270203 [Acaromyces ingoldii]
MASPPPEKAVPIASPLDGEESKLGFAPLSFIISCNLTHAFLLYYQCDSYTTLSLFLSLLIIWDSTVAVWCYHSDRRDNSRAGFSTAASPRYRVLDSVWPWALALIALHCLLGVFRYWIGRPSGCKYTIHTRPLDKVHWEVYVTGDCSESKHRDVVVRTMASYLSEVEADMCGVQCLRVDAAGSWVGHVSLTPADTLVDGTYCGTQYSFGRCAPTQWTAAS